jgi:predicted MFS family arabinose efflux permease
LNIVNSTPYLMDLTMPAERNQIFALQQAVLGLFGFAGSLAAGVLPGLVADGIGVALDSPAAYRYALILTPLSYLVAVLLLMRTQPRPPIQRTAESAHAAAVPYLLIGFVALMIFLQTIGEGTVRAFYNLYLDTTLKVPLSQIGLVMGVGQFLPIITSLAAPSLMMRWGSGGTLGLAAALTSLCMLAMALLGDWGAAVVTYIGVLVSISIAAVARSLFTQEIVPAHWRTMMSVAFTTGLALGWATAAGLGGYVIAASGYRLLFALGAAMAATSALLVWLYLRSSRRHAAAVADRLPAAQ